MRLFTAIEFDKEVKDHISGTVTSLKEAGVRGRFLSPDNYHLTLNFIGETDRLDDIKKIMDSLPAFRPFDLTLGGVGVFKRRSGDILWLGIDNSPELYKIQRRLNRELILADFEVDTGRFKPHITLARKCRIPLEIIKDASLEEASHISFNVKKISLVRSNLTKKGAVYKEIYSIPLSKNR